ncbi:helix-turn-helix domain-containing protein, partial [Streptomyces sp. t39]|uniref:helix-turn-helix domain-containing protein n=1 Tax=Streptomyces sp. t39 TaxID=1828156 RepID=UPI0021C95E7C
MTQSTAPSAPGSPLPPPKERRRLREARSLTEAQVAAVVGVTKATIRSWETGRTSPRGRKREMYAKVLAVHEADLAGSPAAAAVPGGSPATTAPAPGPGDGAGPGGDLVPRAAAAARGTDTVGRAPGTTAAGPLAPDETGRPTGPRGRDTTAPPHGDDAGPVAAAPAAARRRRRGAERWCRVRVVRWAARSRPARGARPPSYRGRG